MSSGIKASPAVVEISPGWHGLGYSTTTCERASGQHAKDLLVVCDEASAIEPEIFDALESLNYSRLLCTLNPILADGPCIDLIRQADKDRRDNIPHGSAVNAIQIRSTESPDADKERSSFGLADRTWLSACERRYGRDSLWYRVHVLAEIPTLLNEQLIPEADLDRCTTTDTAAIVAKIRADSPMKAGRRRLTCDVGEGCGNSKTVIFVLDDLGVLECSASRYTGPRDAAETMCRLAAKWDVKEEGLSFDGAGQTGKSLGNALASKGFPRARAYFGASSAASAVPTYEQLAPSLSRPT